MSNQSTSEDLSKFWARHYVHPETGCCCLCGNSGIVDTRGTTWTPKRKPSGARVFCFCPNGQLIRRETHIEQIYEKAT